ncbi:hypothetical protein NLJ89_g5704 [Agrocybe chaxingu]|uniref:Uncharacterized protein n=1 Tax=Agrocybe chaxingu TaxID=84603 RepID=A0A9W8MTD7_9AGAR|nr:hypothetical protein NLJ89_g5704 [Agrocybe chaxingu]
MLYRIIVQFVDHETLPTRNVPPSSGNTPLDSVCPFARHLLVGGPLKEEEICQIFEASPNVVDLCIWSELPLKKFIHYIHRLCPLRLSVDLASLDLDDFTGPAFSRVTHLDAVGWKGQPWRVWKNVTLLPKLTHLAVNCPVENEVIVGLLSECQHVELLVVFKAGEDWYDLERNDPDKFSSIFTDIDDERLVLLEDNPTGSVLQDWESSASGGMNIWTFAESVLFARQHGLFRESSQRWFICTSMDIGSISLDNF